LEHGAKNAQSTPLCAFVKPLHLDLELSYTPRGCTRESVDPVVQFATTELGAVVVEGIDWPRERDGENLAPVPVAL
jgi:hypothetical protein